VAPSRALVVCYQHVMESSTELVEAIRAAMRERPVDRILLDLRVNGGGEAGGYRELLRFLASAGVRLEVLIGRLTFSAGTSLVVLLQRQVPGVELVGEPTGGAPNLWADPETVTLPSSRLNVLVASRYFGIGGPDDERLAVGPDLAVPFTAEDYFAGRDPVLEAALAAS
jgi:C-terminal processing protease CtpA/Prc